MNARFVVVLLLLAGACGSSKQRRDLVLDEFYYARGTIACIMEKRPKPSDGYRPCLHIGTTHVGDDYAELAMRIGQPYASEVVDEGRGYAHVYVLDNRPETATYIAYWERNGRIMAIQLTGSGSVPSLDFAGVHLGDGTADLVERLGPTAAIEHGEGYDLWSYRPFPFSMEVRDGRVYSIKIWSPDHAPCACGEPGCCGGGTSE